MRPLHAATLLGLLSLASSSSAIAEKKTEKKSEKQGVIDPRADAALHRMSDYLGGLQSFRVKTTSSREKVTTEGQKIQEIHASIITVQRPNELRVDRTGPNGEAVLRYDGKEISVYNSTKNAYAVHDAPPTLDATIDELRDSLNIDAPGGDLLVPDSYEILTDGLVVGRYIGLEPVGGGATMAHHIAISKKDVDVQIWIEDGPTPVPLRYVITSKDVRAQPEYEISLRDWQPNVSVSADKFAFERPAGAKRVELTGGAR
jgi:hypothetical protein